MRIAKTSDFPFWRFSLAVYDKPGVPEICIDLQDRHGVDVNILLYLLFRARDAVALGRNDIERLDAGLAPWRTRIVHPLRHVRRALKEGEFADLARDDDALRSQVKATELQAEKLQQRMLERIGSGIPGEACADVTEAVRQTWRAYAAHLDAPLPDNERDAFLAALAAAEPGAPA